MADSFTRFVSIRAEVSGMTTGFAPHQIWRLETAQVNIAVLCVSAEGAFRLVCADEHNVY